jgi:hypothetical protein
MRSLFKDLTKNNNFIVILLSHVSALMSSKRVHESYRADAATRKPQGINGISLRSQTQTDPISNQSDLTKAKPIKSNSKVSKRHEEWGRKGNGPQSTSIEMRVPAGSIQKDISTFHQFGRTFPFSAMPLPPPPSSYSSRLLLWFMYL